jgi:hypothetical protein
MTVVAEADHHAMIVVNVAVVMRPYLQKACQTDQV